MSPLVQALLFGFAGLALGAVFFAALLWNVRAYVRGGIGLVPILVHVARLVLAGAVFWWVAHHGALALLSCAVGFVLARVITSQLVRRAPC